MDSDCAGIHGNIRFGFAGRKVVATFYKVAFSLPKVTLVVKKEANFYRCDSY